MHNVFEPSLAFLVPLFLESNLAALGREKRSPPGDKPEGIRYMDPRSDNRAIEVEVLRSSVPPYLPPDTLKL